MEAGDARVIKQCSYCNRVLGEDGEYHDAGLTKPIGRIAGIPVSHAVCPACYEELVRLVREKPAPDASAAKTR